MSDRAFRRRILRAIAGFTAGMALLALIPLPGHAGLFSREWTWPKVLTLVRERFPDVTHISTVELERRLRLPEPERPVSLDARSAEEFAVSHLKDARPAFSEAMAFESLAGIGKPHPVVVYCSVGYRSAGLARKLAARGYSNVANLEGSLFAWANEGKPLYSGTRLADRIHPFDADWGALLKPELR